MFFNSDNEKAPLKVMYLSPFDTVKVDRQPAFFCVTKKLEKRRLKQL